MNDALMNNGDGMAEAKASLSGAHESKETFPIVQRTAVFAEEDDGIHENGLRLAIEEEEKQSPVAHTLQALRCKADKEEGQAPKREEVKFDDSKGEAASTFCQKRF